MVFQPTSRRSRAGPPPATGTPPTSDRQSLPAPAARESPKKRTRVAFNYKIPSPSTATRTPSTSALTPAPTSSTPAGTQFAPTPSPAPPHGSQKPNDGSSVASVTPPVPLTVPIQSGVPKEACPVADSLLKSNDAMYNYLINLLQFLMEHRPIVANSFMTAIGKLYDDDYRKKRVMPITSPGNATRPPNDDVNTSRDTPLSPLPAFISRFSRIDVDDPVLQRSFELECKVMERWERLKEGKGVTKGEDAQGYIVWENGDNPPVVLPNLLCAKAPILCNAAGQLFHSCKEAFRFLWLCLIEDPSSGAILQHPISFPRIELMLTFVCLVRTSMKRFKGGKRWNVLIITNEPVLKRWQEIVSSVDEYDFVRFADPITFAYDVKQWTRDGGVLACSVSVLHKLISLKRSTKRQEVLHALQAGADIAVLDQASKLSSFSPDVRRLLDRIKTRRRLAVSSMPLAGHLLESWHVMNWAVPGLMGSEEEYWEVFAKHITRGHSPGATEPDKLRANSVATYLHRVREFVTYNIDSATWINHLCEKGYNFRECNLFVDMSEDHATLYRHVTEVVEESVRSMKITEYVALHLLLAAATGGSALSKLLHNGLGEKGGEFGKAVESHETGWRRLRESFHDLLEKNIRSRKIELVTSLALKCLERSKRLVIFVSSPHVQHAVRTELNSLLSNDDPRVFELESSETSKSQASHVAMFNASKDGALILAPYGPTVECIEESGWGMISASHAVVVDSDWNLTCTTQVLERLCNPNALSTVVIYYLISADTIEAKLHQSYIKGERGSLVIPEIAFDALLSQEVEAARRASAFVHVPLIDVSTNASCETNTTDEDILRSCGVDEQYLSCDTDTSRYLLARELLTSRLNSQSKPDKNFWTLVQDVQEEYTGRFARSMQEVQDECDDSHRGHPMPKLRKTRVLQGRERFEDMGQDEDDGVWITERWRPYFYLYERQKMRAQSAQASPRKRTVEDLFGSKRDVQSRAAQRRRSEGRYLNR